MSEGDIGKRLVVGRQVSRYAVVMDVDEVTKIKITKRGDTRGACVGSVVGRLWTLRPFGESDRHGSRGLYLCLLANVGSWLKKKTYYLKAPGDLDRVEREVGTR